MKKMVNGVLVDLTPEEIEEATPSLDAAKVQKIKEIESTRDTEAIANVSFGGYTWQADQKSQALLSQAILLAQAGVYTPTTWRTADNLDIPVNLAFLVGIAGTIALQVSVAYTTSWNRKAQVSAATTIADVTNV